MNTIEKSDKYLADTYGRFPIVIESGKGAILHSADGREYIDFGAGIAVSTFGAADGEWLAAVTAQAARVAHTSNYYYNEPQGELAEMLCERTGARRVFLSNSGAEANECAIKAARKYSSDKYGAGRYKIITLVNGFHGRTMATITATGQDVFHKHFDPFLEGFVYVPANDAEALEKAMSGGDVCAFMFEIVQGESGVNPLDFGYLKKAAALAAERDILLIADEVQTGNGRTGTLYAYEQTDIVPDILTTAKGLAGGLPLGATLFFEKTENTLGRGDHGSTFGGNPVSAAGAVSVLSRIDEKLLSSVREKSDFIKNSLCGAEGVTGVSGLGLMLGVSVVGDAKKIAAKCAENGLLVLTAKDRVRLLPPLNIGDTELEKGLNILKGVIKNEAFA